MILASWGVEAAVKENLGVAWFVFGENGDGTPWGKRTAQGGNSVAKGGVGRVFVSFMQMGDL